MKKFNAGHGRVVLYSMDGQCREYRGLGTVVLASIADGMSRLAPKYPSLSLMFVPGTYDEMHRDYD